MRPGHFSERQNQIGFLPDFFAVSVRAADQEKKPAAKPETKSEAKSEAKPETKTKKSTGMSELGEELQRKFETEER